MKYILIIFMISFTTPAIAGDIQHFNPDIFGKSADACALLLLPSKGDAIKPSQVRTDINEKGIFYAATIIYPETVLFEEARESINKLYKKYEVKTFADNPSMGIWRNEEKRFTIQLNKRDESDPKGGVYVIYIWLDR